MAKAQEIRPKMIIAGASAYPRAIDFKMFRHIADKVGAYLLVDMAHYFRIDCSVMSIPKSQCPMQTL